MDIVTVTILLFLSLTISLLIGVPIAFSLGGLSVIFGFFLWGPESLYLAVTSTLGTMDSFLLLAVPLFIFMGHILESSGIGSHIDRMMHVWMGPLRGGLAIGTVIIC